jgi:hypothetical protein
VNPSLQPPQFIRQELDRAEPKVVQRHRPLTVDLALDWWVRCRWSKDKIGVLAFTTGH